MVNEKVKQLMRKGYGVRTAYRMARDPDYRPKSQHGSTPTSDDGDGYIFSKGKWV